MTVFRNFRLDQKYVCYSPKTYYERKKIVNDNQFWGSQDPMTSSVNRSKNCILPHNLWNYRKWLEHDQSRRRPLITSVVNTPRITARSQHQSFCTLSGTYVSKTEETSGCRFELLPHQGDEMYWTGESFTMDGVSVMTGPSWSCWA